MWRDVIRRNGPSATFAPPAGPDRLAAAEAALGPLPAALVDLYRETDGVTGTIET